jgi:dTDP-glucose pyrophosphorylase
MAAGSSARYRKLKQIDPLGPSGETLIDYAAFDALQCGFRKVVVVIRRDIEELFRTAVGRRIEKQLEVAYAFQDELPSTAFSRVINRKKPWGTAHAMLSAADLINEPFAVINADDYYGRESFLALSEHFHIGHEQTALVGFRLQDTLSDFGPVKRALCTMSDDQLNSVTEVGQIERIEDTIKCVDADGVSSQLAGDEIVSMNMWGFYPTIFASLHDKWMDFARDYGQSEVAEFYIPNTVTTLITQGKIKCRVLATSDRWFGMTYPEDRALAIKHIQNLIEKGVYPKDLWAW